MLLVTSSVTVLNFPGSTKHVMVTSFSDESEEERSETRDTRLPSSADLLAMGTLMDSRICALAIGNRSPSFSCMSLITSKA